MPGLNSGESGSDSSSNESDTEEVRARRTPNSVNSPSPDSQPGSPGGSEGGDSAHSHRTRSRTSGGSRSRSESPAQRIQNGPNSPIERHGSPNQRSNSGSSFGEFRSPGSGPASPKFDGSGSRPHSPGSGHNSFAPPAGLESPASSRDNSPNGRYKSPERLHNRGPRSPEQMPKSEAVDSDDNASLKSHSSGGSRKSRGRSSSRSSSRGSRRRSRSGSDSDSSVSSVDSSSRKNKDVSRAVDTKPEDISDGDMESDHEKPAEVVKKEERPSLKISHEDLSDVSDLEDSMGGNSDAEAELLKDRDDDVGDAKDSKMNGGNEQKSSNVEKKTHEPIGSSRPDEGEEQLDFEAEDGECDEISKDGDNKEEKEDVVDDRKDKEGPSKEEKELEEGEVTDEDDARPEETEPRPVCRFFSRGACTWGASCRFLHPGVTDKGNYTMFDMVRPMLPGDYGMGRMADDRVYKPDQPLQESAWERGLRTAKEMLKKSIRRKEQDIDFEEKKMNLSIAQEEFDKENGYYGRIPSPEPRYVRHMPPEYSMPRPPPEEYYGRRPVVYEPEYLPPVRREHPRQYREMPPPRGPPPPDYYGSKYEEEPPILRAHERVEGRERERERERRKPKREVIVQRAEKEERVTRGDEWQDPWMRSKSPGRRKERKRSYSSGSSSYSSSSSRSSTASSKSSYRSRSRSTFNKGRSRSRTRGGASGGAGGGGGGGGGRHVSPSVIVSERKAANERAALMNPPAPKRRAPSPGMMRVSSAANPPAPSKEDLGRTRNKLAVAAALARVKSKTRRSSKSSSGSSSGSSSESESSESSSSSSRSNSPPPPSSRETRKAELVKAMDALKGGALEKTKIKLNLKNPPGVRKPPAEVADARKLEAAKKRPAASPPPNESKAKKATSRREELLKQLKAVEDAIAKKRSKV